jgi:hypothetical protein
VLANRLRHPAMADATTPATPLDPPPTVPMIVEAAAFFR